MQKIENNLIKLKVIALVLDIVIYVYFSLNIYWMFGVVDMDTHPLTRLFMAINPMTVGVYAAGIAMLVHLVAYRNILGRCVICVPFILSAVASTVSLMGMTGWKDCAIFIPDVIIICLAITIVAKQRKTENREHKLY